MDTNLYVMVNFLMMQFVMCRIFNNPQCYCILLLLLKLMVDHWWLYCTVCMQCNVFTPGIYHYKKRRDVLTRLWSPQLHLSASLHGDQGMSTQVQPT